MIIIGAGLAGLIAATQWPSAEVYEAGNEPQHKALLRFRTPDVGNAVGIDFRAVKVHKGIWFDNAYRKPSIQLSNFYSQKVVGRLASRSINDITACERYVAPNDFIERLVEICHKRIHWNCAWNPTDVWAISHAARPPVISTMPMPVLAKALTPNAKLPEFKHASIAVQRFKIPGADVFQTVYFPDPHTNVYRASITGDLLIIEAMYNNFDSEQFQIMDIDLVMRALGLSELEPFENPARQNYGKIIPTDDAWRRRFIFETTINNGIYSLGRFATWRNILLDDVLHDIKVIKNLLAGDTYSIARKK